MTEERRRNVAGPIIGILGYLGFLFYFLVNFAGLNLGPFGTFLGASFFFPLALVVVGRALTRGDRRRRRQEAASQERRESPRPLAPRPVSRSKPPPPAPTPLPAPTPVDTAKLRVPVADEPGLLEPVTEPMDETEPRVADLVPEFRPKTSEEMIAEAKRRIGS